MQNVPENLHRQQGVNHLTRVLNYAPLVVEEGKATVHLTAEDWHVVMDTLFHMDTPKDELPDEIKEYSVSEDGQRIQLTTEDMLIDLEQI